MPRPVHDGAFYAFDRSRASASYEVGDEITENWACVRVKLGRDVYTPRQSDAKGLAKKVVPSPPEWHPAHRPEYFPHYYPDGAGWGHIFYGRRGEYFEE